MASPEEKMLAKMEEIAESLTTFLSLYKAVNSKAIEQIKEALLKADIRQKAYELCDNTRSVTQIAQIIDPNKELKKNVALTSYHLTILERSGLLWHRDEGGQRYYYRTLE
jgi:hypothetical protein